MEQKSFEYSEFNFGEKESNMYVNNMGCTAPKEIMCGPIQECPQERVCHRYICYEVPHIMPCNTRIINHHIYRHT